MALVPARCTQCAGQIEVDNTRDAGICTHCGTAFITEKVVNNFVTNINNTQNISNTQNIVKHIYGREKTEAQEYIANGETFLQLKDWAKAEELFTKATDENPRLAMGWAGLGRAYALGADKDEHFLSSAEYFDRALTFANTDERAAIEKMRDTHLVNADIQTNIADAYMDDDQTEKALFWYKKGAMGGNADAMLMVGIYHHGQGDFAVAKSFFENAAKQGVIAGLRWLGDMYRDGNGMPRNLQTAQNFYENAKAAGLPQMQERIEGVHAMIAAEMPDGADKISYLESVAKAGDITAHQALIGIFTNGIGTKKDAKKASYVSERLRYAQAKNRALDEHVAGTLNTQELIRHFDGLVLEIHAKPDPVNKYLALAKMVVVVEKGYVNLSHKRPEIVQKYKEIGAQWFGDFKYPSGACYIATAVYGSYDCKEVWVLRRYRDNRLAASVCGRIFIKIYYKTSPTAIKMLGKYAWFNKFWQKRLDKKVEKLMANGVESTIYRGK